VNKSVFKLVETPRNWKEKRLKDVIYQFIGGGTPESGNEEYWTDQDDGIPWVAISDMTKSLVITRTEKQISKHGLDAKRLVILPKNTLLFSMYASLGQVAILNIPATTNQAILGLIPSDKILTGFLRYWLETLKPLLPYMASSNLPFAYF